MLHSNDSPRLLVPGTKHGLWPLLAAGYWGGIGICTLDVQKMLSFSSWPPEAVGCTLSVHKKDSYEGGSMPTSNVQLRLAFCCWAAVWWPDVYGYIWLWKGYSQMVVEPGWTMKTIWNGEEGGVAPVWRQMSPVQVQAFACQAYWVTTVMNMQYPHTFSHCKHPLHSSRGAPEVDQRWGLLGCISRAQKAPDQNNHVVSGENSTKMPEMQKKPFDFCGFRLPKEQFWISFFEKKCPV